MRYLRSIFYSILFLGMIVTSTDVLAHGSGTGPVVGADGVIVTRHFSGLWEQPDHQNQGFTLHVVHQYSGERIAVAYWFTYAQDKEPTWLVGQGPVIGNRIELTLYRLSGIGFLQPIDPDLNVGAVVGSAVMEFDSCQTGTVTYETDMPGMEEGSFPIEQLGWILNTHCTGGISDDMPVDAMYGQQAVWMTPAHEGIQGSGRARFESFPNQMVFDVEADGLPDGDYHLYIGTEDHGGFSVQQGHGEIRFSSPREDGHMLLNFEPRGQRIEIHDAGGAVISSFDDVMDEDDHSPYRGIHGNGYGDDEEHHYACDGESGMGGMGGMGGGHGNHDCVEEGDFVEIGIDLDNTGVLAEAEGEAEWEMNARRVHFSVEIEDVPAGDYPLHVGGEEVGVIEAFEMHHGGVFGHIGFSDPESYGVANMDFDPRGQTVEVMQGENVILEVDFPAE